MASTEETDSRAISSSTSRKSAFTRSKTSFAEKACPSLLIATKLSSVAQTQPLKISSGERGQLMRRHSADLGQLPRGLDKKGRLVTLAPVRDRREIRRVGFNQQSVRRRHAGSLPDLVGFGECQDTAETEMKSEIQRLLRF